MDLVGDAGYGAGSTGGERSLALAGGDLLAGALLARIGDWIRACWAMKRVCIRCLKICR
jgi:hypothetical protein